MLNFLSLHLVLRIQYSKPVYNSTQYNLSKTETIIKINVKLQDSKVAAPGMLNHSTRLKWVVSSTLLAI